ACDDDSAVGADGRPLNVLAADLEAPFDGTPSGIGFDGARGCTSGRGSARCDSERSCKNRCDDCNCTIDSHGRCDCVSLRRNFSFVRSDGVLAVRGLESGNPVDPQAGLQSVPKDGVYRGSTRGGPATSAFSAANCVCSEPQTCSQSAKTPSSATR